MVKALYGMIQSALLFYKKFRKDLEGIGSKVNDYDPCVANRIYQWRTAHSNSMLMMLSQATNNLMLKTNFTNGCKKCMEIQRLHQ